MTDRRLFLAALAAGVAGLAASANADIIANWTFETSAPATAGPFAAEAGANAASSFASGVHASATAFSSPTGNGSARSFSANTWAIGDYYQFTTSTVGYSGIAIQWDQTSSNTGPRDFVIQWSIDGSSFTNLGSQYSVLANASPNNVWTAGTPRPEYNIGNFAGPAALDNQATVYFRVRMNTNTSANGGTVAGGGTDRVDNVVISGTIPTPGTMGLMGLAGLVSLRRRR